MIGRSRWTEAPRLDDDADEIVVAVDEPIERHSARPSVDRDDRKIYKDFAEKI
jgi:hypothetical protein